MPDDDDATLLRAWTKGRSESAFRRLVERYGGLVYGAALRRTDDAELASEAAQDVFVRLARQAGSLRRPESLPAWLHTAAVHVAADRLRSESRYRERMKRYSQQTPPDDDGSAPAWREALPLLDEAIGRLSEADRGLVLARYCQGESVAGTARRFGISPAAAQKRGERALEKLAAMLRRRGVAVSAVTLASGLGEQLSRAAPAAMSAKWSAAAITAGPGASGGGAITFLTIMNTKAVSLAAAVIALAIPVGLQLSANAKARAASSLSDRGTKSDAGTKPGGRRGSASGSSSGGRRMAEVDLTVLAREIRSFPPRTGRLQKELELRTAMSTLNAAQCAEVAGWLADAPGRTSMSEIIFDLFSRWAGLDKEEAAAYAELPAAEPLGSMPRSAVLHTWATLDPRGMLERFSPGINTGGDGVRTAACACREALRVLTRSDPHGALQTALRLDSPPKHGLAKAALMGWSDATGPQAPLQWLAEEAPAEQRSALYGGMIGYLQDTQPEAAWLSLLTWSDRVVAEEHACSTLNLWAAHDPDRAVAAWLAGPPEWRSKHFAHNLVSVLAYANPATAERLARELPDAALREYLTQQLEDRRKSGGIRIP